jgi:hypothetical protein
MGHWEEGGANPTFLASGFTPWDPNAGPRKILVYMWPIQVETEFTSNLHKPTDGNNLNEPVTYNKGVFELWPAASEMKWRLMTAGDEDPLVPLIAA